jgi:hypothetical protein
MDGPTTISIAVPRPLTEWEMSDVKQAVEQIMAHKTFFYGGDDPLGDEVRAFLVGHPITSNLEFIPADGEAS